MSNLGGGGDAELVAAEAAAAAAAAACWSSRRWASSGDFSSLEKLKNAACLFFGESKNKLFTKIVRRVVGSRLSDFAIRVMQD